MAFLTKAVSRLVIIGPDFKDTEALRKANIKFFLKHIPRKRCELDGLPTEQCWSISKVEVAVKHLFINNNIHEDPKPPKPLTRSRICSWSLKFLHDQNITTMVENSHHKR